MLIKYVLKLSPEDRRFSGVYMIRNRINGKTYIGSSASSIKHRIKHHIWALRKGEHYNLYLQRAWIKYGEQAFEFSVLELCSPESCLTREEFFIRKFRATEASRGYNAYAIPAKGPLGIKRPASVGKAVAEANRRRVVSELTRRRMSETRKGIPLTTNQAGVSNGNAKLNDAKVREIRRLWGIKQFETKKALARYFGVGSTAVSDILAGRRWAHVS